MSEGAQLTALRAWYVLGSSTWSGDSLIGRPSKAARNDFAKDTSVIAFVCFESERARGCICRC